MNVKVQENGIIVVSGVDSTIIEHLIYVNNAIGTLVDRYIAPVKPQKDSLLLDGVREHRESKHAWARDDDVLGFVNRTFYDYTGDGFIALLERTVPGDWIGDLAKRFNGEFLGAHAVIEEMEKAKVKTEFFKQIDPIDDGWKVNVFVTNGFDRKTGKMEKHVEISYSKERHATASEVLERCPDLVESRKV